MSVSIKTEKLIFSVFCPYLKRTVFLRKETWFYKVCQEHPEVSNRIELVKDILAKDDESILRYRKKRNPSRIALFKECPHLLPCNKYIKIALCLLNDIEAVITTVHGQNNLPNTFVSDMEEIK